MLSCVAGGFIAWYFLVHVPFEKERQEREQIRLMKAKEKQAKEQLDQQDAVLKELTDKVQEVNTAADSLQGLLDSFSRRHPDADSLWKEEK